MMHNLTIASSTMGTKKKQCNDSANHGRDNEDTRDNTNITDENGRMDDGGSLPTAENKRAGDTRTRRKSGSHAGGKKAATNKNKTTAKNSGGGLCNKTAGNRDSGRDDETAGGQGPC